jgi:hypothetical protein
MILLRILEDNSQLALAGIEDQGDAFKHAFEAGSLLFQMAQTGGGDLISADPAVGGRDTPLRLHELGFEQALERRIERSFFHLEQVVRSLLDVLDKRIPMGGLAAKRLEDHHFECAGKEIARRGCFHRLYSDRHRLNKYQAFGKGKALGSGASHARTTNPCRPRTSIRGLESA